MLSCESCQVKFETELQCKAHYKSEYHTFNLLRSMKGLCAVTLNDYEQIKKEYEKVSSKQMNSKKSTYYCQYCKKKFSNQLSYENHSKSKKHLKKVEESEYNSEGSIESEIQEISESDSSSESGDGHFFTLGDCLFCDTCFENSSCLIDHMELKHGFYLPFKEHLVDVEGLLLELYRIIEEERACLACGKEFYGANIEVSSSKQMRKQLKTAISSVRKHMIDKQHTNLWCGEDDPIMLALKVAQNPDNTDSAKCGGELFHQFYDGSTFLPKIISPDDDEMAYEVILPSGASIGHRQYNFIYNQKIPVTGSLFEASNKSILPKYSNITNSAIINGFESDRAILLKNFKLKELKRVAKEQEARIRDVVNKADSLAVGMSNNIVFRGRHRRQY